MERNGSSPSICITKVRFIQRWKNCAGQVLSPSRDLGSLSFDPMILKRNRELGVLDAQNFSANGSVSVCLTP
ncbi:MAG: hypothetical protein ACLSA6_08675 [Holdemania massiliensis]